MPNKPKQYRPSGYKSHDQRRGTSTERGYDYRWQQFRKAFLQENPLCEDCKQQGRVTAAKDVHHIIKVQDDPTKRLEWDNLMALCSDCHDRRTRRGE